MMTSSKLIGSAITVTLWWLNILSYPVLAAEIEAIAMVTDVQGKAEIKNNKDMESCTILASLYSGSELILSVGAEITLVDIKEGKEYSYTGPAKIKITDNAPLVIEGKKGIEREFPLAKETGLIPAESGIKQAALVLRGMPAQKKLRLLSPVNTRLLDQQPVFVWKEFTEAKAYRFTLQDSQGQILIDIMTSDTKATLPDDLKLQAGKVYEWTVEAQLVSGERYASSAGFTIITEEERQDLQKVVPKHDATFGERIIFTGYLEKIGMKDEAKKYWQQLSSERPEDITLKRRAENN